MIRGVLFDMDGVLVDSERFICEAAIRMFRENGVEAQEQDFVPFVGTGENRYIGGVAEKYGIRIPVEQMKSRTYAIYAEIVRGRLEPLAGVEDFIAQCKSKGLKIAVATSADKVKMETNLREIGLPESVFDATVNGLEVGRKKPDPEVFQKAAAKLGLRPEECLVVEDAVNGVAAGKAAGAKVLGLMTSFSAEELSQADWVAKDLASVPSEVLCW